MKLVSDASASPAELRQRLRHLDADVRASVERRGRPWSGVPLISYLATEVLYLEEAWSRVQRLCPTEDRVPALSLLSLEGFIDSYPKALHQTIIHRALELKDSNWAVACRQYLDAVDGDLGLDDASIFSWPDFLERRGQPLVLLGPYTRYAGSRGAPRPLIDLRLCPGNFPDSREVVLPARALDGMEWFSCFEAVVIRTLKKGDEDEDYISRIALVPDRWLRDRSVRAETQARFGVFGVSQTAFGGHDDIVVMGQRRWWLELCLALALERGGLLSRRFRNQVVEDLAPQMERRLVEHWKTGQPRERDTRRVARELFDYLVKNFRRPLYARSLGGAFKAGVKMYRKAASAPGSVSVRTAKAVQAAGIELAPNPDELRIEEALDLRRRCEKVVDALDPNTARTPAWIAKTTGIAVELVTCILALACETGQAEHVGHGRYRRRS